MKKTFKLLKDVKRNVDGKIIESKCIFQSVNVMKVCNKFDLITKKRKGIIIVSPDGKEMGFS